MFSKILVPLDGSKLAERAIMHARYFARVFNAELFLMQVLDSNARGEDPSAVEPLNWQIRKAQSDLYLQDLAAQLRGAGMRVSTVLREGKTAENIIDFAHAEDIDLLILTTHGSSGLSRWNTSSVVQKVIEKVYAPVLLVRAYAPVAAGTVAGGMEVAAPPEDAPLYTRILIPIDTSRRAECAISAAMPLAQHDVQLILAAVIRPPELPIPAPYPEEINGLIQRFVQISRDAVNSYLAEQQMRLPANVEVRTAETDNVSAALHDLVAQEDVDLVVLCAHGQTGGMHWPYGSVARNYIEHGDRTVLVIQDVPRAQVRPTAAEMAAEKYGRR